MQPRKSRAPSAPPSHALLRFRKARPAISRVASTLRQVFRRSEEHTSELQSRLHLVCRLLLEKKKKNHTRAASTGKLRLTQGRPHDRTRSQLCVHLTSTWLGVRTTDTVQVTAGRLAVQSLVLQ